MNANFKRHLILTIAIMAVITGTVACRTCSRNPASPGLVSFWSGAHQGKDSARSNHGTLNDVAFEQDQFGRAFVFNGTNSYIKIPASLSLDVGAGNGFTISAWIKPLEVSQTRPIVSWNSGTGNDAVHLHNTHTGVLYADITDENGGWHRIWTVNNALAVGEFQHVALTYDKTTGVAGLYVNGIAPAIAHIDGSGHVLGNIAPRTRNYDVYVGKRPPTGGNSDEYFVGLIDQIGIYNRALSADEITKLSKATR